MDIKSGSIVDTVIEYAAVKFGVDLTAEQASEQLRELSFSDTVELVHSIKNEDDDGFTDYVDLSVVSESGGTIAPSSSAMSSSRATVTSQKNAARRANNTAQDSARDSTSVQRTVAGANKKATGSANRASGNDNNASKQNAEQSAKNAQAIERLKQLALGNRK